MRERKKLTWRKFEHAKRTAHCTLHTSSGPEIIYSVLLRIRKTERTT